MTWAWLTRLTCFTHCAWSTGMVLRNRLGRLCYHVRHNRREYYAYSQRIF